MATRTQAKAAIDNVAIAIKADIDAIVPATANISDGNIAFTPQHWNIYINAGGSSTTADSFLATITANLATAGRATTVTRSGRRSDDSDHTITIKTTLANYLIVNF